VQGSLWLIILAHSSERARDHNIQYCLYYDNNICFILIYIHMCVCVCIYILIYIYMCIYIYICILYIHNMMIIFAHASEQAKNLLGSVNELSRLAKEAAETAAAERIKATNPQKSSLQRLYIANTLGH